MMALLYRNVEYENLGGVILLPTSAPLANTNAVYRDQTGAKIPLVDFMRVTSGPMENPT
jgi:hypothetical protein